MSPSFIKAAYESRNDGSRHFFDPGTMSWFGDTMRSFGTRTIDGVVYMYRKPSATVNVFGKHQIAGRAFFNAWRFDIADADLHFCNAEDTQRVWDTVT